MGGVWVGLPAVKRKRPRPSTVKRIVTNLTKPTWEWEEKGGSQKQKSDRKFDGRMPGPDRVSSVLRQRARESFAARLEILERIADGDLVYRKRRMNNKGGAEVEEFEPSPKDRIYALELIGKVAGVMSPEQGEALQADPAAIAKALTVALRDPSVKDWLMNQPQIMGLLTKEAERVPEPSGDE